ncbi:MAG: ABC transporter permease [Blautia sp.]|uniref:ABC transporter permease n=1 Tax=Blautia sp. TaxID=1955243 RepID=UPI002E766E11|nr:ABC transporter permease [Blautia sp.]MEE1444829.1 ABC transporter permease [Blautia sp.]
MVKTLLKASQRQNRRRNRLLMLAVALIGAVIFCIFSFAYEKLQADIQKNIQTDGMAVSAYLENGTEEMVEQIKTLSFVKCTGKEKFAGKLLDKNLKYCDCVVADKTAFEEMLSPAYTQVTGHYPKKAEEIMLSLKTLEYLNIKNPQIGMEVNLDFYWNDIFNTKGTGAQSFRLSGYFTEYENQETGSSLAFLSEEKLTESGVSWNPCRILIDPKYDFVSGLWMESILKDVLPLEKGQKMVCVDSAAYRAVEGMLGSCGFAAIFSFFLLLGMFLFVYEILNLSLQKDLQQYGLLEVIGAQKKQIMQILVFQMWEVWLKGNLIGGFVGSLAVLVILKDLSLYQLGVLFLTMLSTAFPLVAGVFTVRSRLKRLNPIECLKYEEIPFAPKSQKKQKYYKIRNWGRMPEVYLAKRYLFCNGRGFILTLFSLTMGCGLALCSVVLEKGTDIENRFLAEPDFRISITQKACQTLMETSPDTKHMVFFPEAWLGNLQDVAGDSLQNIEKIYGFYPIVGERGQESIKVLSEGTEVATVIQALSSVSEERLKSFIKKENLNVDWNTFYQENGALILHNHRISEYAMKSYEEKIGTEIEVYDLVPVGTEMAGLTPETMVNCGYLDITKDDFPSLNLVWNGKDTNILLVTEATYKKFAEHLTPQTFELTFFVEPKQEPYIKGKLKNWIQTYNMEFQSEQGYHKLNLLQMECKSDVLLKEKSHIQTSRLFFLAISGCLIFMGSMNFLNVRITGMMLRKKECILMGQVGMTKKQQKRMFLAEGIFTWLWLCGLLVTFGTVLLCAVGWYMQTKISYFVFYYPIKELILMLLILLGGSVLLQKDC